MARKPRAEFEITAEDKSAAQLRQAEKQLQAIAGNVKNIALAATGALAGLGAAVIKIGANLDKLAKTAKSAGVGVETFQAWEFAATQSGVSVEQFASAMVRANTAVGQVANGTGPALDVFNRLGIAVRDVNGDVRSTESVVRDFAGAVAQLKTPAEQAAAAATLFGREAGPRMALLLREGEDGLKRFEDQARQLGIVVSKEATENAEKLTDRMDQLRRVITAQTANAIFENARAIDSLAEAMARVVGASVRGVASVTNFAEWLGEELAARIGGIAANDIPRLMGALSDARAELARLQTLGEKGLLSTNRGLTPEQQMRAARAEVDKYTEALARARDMEARGLGFQRPGDRRPSPAPVELLPEAGLTEGALKAAEDRASRENALRIRFARELNQALESEARSLAEAELRIFQEKIAQAAGFRDLAAQQEYEKEQQIFTARMDGMARQFEEELAVELGYKDARDRAIQDAEQSHQDALLEIRTREFGTYQRLAIQLAKLENATARERTQFALQQAQQLTAGLATNSKTMFNINKALSIANATVNTAEGVTKALSQANFPLAALIAATGAAQIATISSTQFGGASSGLTGAGPGTGIPSMANDLFTAPTVSTEERNRSTIRLEIVADDSDVARALIKNARVVLDDEDGIIAGRGSRQSLEFVT
jgi:hypothetical protein